MQELLIITGVASAITLLLSHDNYSKLLKTIWLDFRPFNCEICMAFWTSGIIAETLQVGTFLTTLLIAFTTAMVTSFTFRHFNRL